MLYHGSAFPQKKNICTPKTSKYDLTTNTYNDTILRVLPVEYRLPAGSPSPAGDSITFESDNVFDWGNKDGHVSRLVRSLIKGYLPLLVPRLYAVKPRYHNQQFSVGNTFLI